ncbi:hypothetical protein [Flavobacterium sp. GCM10023249]|uniref:hypothetical protein n=1 Tax=unclassified Flavobacterium TaxID=196869 RepID=UPI00361F884E
MYNLIAKLMSWYEHHKIDINDITGLIVTIILGNFIKIYREPENPNKWRFSRFISELLLSSLIAFTFYKANDLWLHLPYLFTMILCVWFGSLSSKIFDEMDNLISWAFETVKAYFNKKFLTPFIAITTGMLLIGCKGSQPVATKQNQQINTEISNHNLRSEIIKNQAIIDSLKISIGEIKTSKPECDSITQAAIKELLNRLNTKKISGNNSFGAYYDTLKNEIVMYANIAATQDEKIKELEWKLSRKEQTTKENKPVKYIPKEVKVLAFFGLLLLLYFLYKILKPLILWVGKRSLPLP